MDKNFKDQFRGALLGLACGDALGTTLEFKPPGSFTPITDIIGGGQFDLQPGQWTDDTSMALCLAESLVESQGFDPKDQLQRYVRWWREGHLSSTGSCFDIGNATATALRRFEKTDEEFCGSSDPHSAGNGSIMRLAPVVMHFAIDGSMAIEYAGHSSRTTHAAPVCVDACRYLAGLIWGLLRNDSKEYLLSSKHGPFVQAWEETPLAPEIAEIADGSFRRKEPPEIKGSGYVVKSLEAALWAFHKTDNFRDGALLAVNLGDDADTTGAIYGQIAGACYGARDIPPEWLEKLAMRDVIEDLIERLYEPIAQEYDLNEYGRLTKRYSPEEIREMQELNSAEVRAYTFLIPGQPPMSLDEMAEYRKKEAEKKKRERAADYIGFGMREMIAEDVALEREAVWRRTIKDTFDSEDQPGPPANAIFYSEWVRDKDALSARAQLMREAAARVLDRLEWGEKKGALPEVIAEQEGETKVLLELIAKDWERAIQLDKKSAELLLKAAKYQEAAEQALEAAIQTQKRLANLINRKGKRKLKASKPVEGESDTSA